MNEIYVSEYNGESFFGISYYMVVVDASSIEVARETIKTQLGFDIQPTLLIGATYPTIYNQTGTKPLDTQVKILFNGNCHYRE
jgi:hypothetical protein